MNVTITNIAAVEKMILYVTISLPENTADKLYRKEVVRSVFDVEKILKGIRGVPVIGAIMDDFFKAADFEARFPFPPVSCKEECLKFLIQFLRRGLTKLRASLYRTHTPQS